MTSLWPVFYALSLAERMDVRIYVLLVEDPSVMPIELREDPEDEPSMKERLEALILKGRSEGITVDYYITGGSYADELIKFIQEKKISLLVVGLPFPEKNRDSQNLPELLKEIRLRTNCRIEIVHQKTDRTESGRS